MSDLERWRRGPAPRGSGQSVAKYLDQVAEISGLGVGKLGIEAMVPPRRLAELARYGMTASASLIRRHPEATGATGGLFPALDADIRISAEDGKSVTVTLTGSYRPPLGMLGAELDRLLLRAVATATIRTLLARIAATLEGAPAEALQVDRRTSPVPPCTTTANSA